MGLKKSCLRWGIYFKVKILLILFLNFLFARTISAEELNPLENGLRVIVKERPETRTVALQVWVRVGSRDEREGEQGVTHLLAHMILKGTKDLPAEVMAAKVASLGGRMGGGTSQEHSQYYAEVPDTGYPEMLKILLEMVNNPAFREEDLPKEKQVVLTEIGRLKDIPESSVDELALREVFKGHPMANPVRGDEKTLKKITRDLLIQQYQTYYRPANTVVVVVGNAKMEEVVKIVREGVGGWGGEIVKEGSSTTLPPLYPEQIKRHEVSIGGILLQQARILLAIRVMGIQDKDRPAMEVLSSIIQLRLFEAIRETHGLAYVVDSNYIPLSDTGIWKIYVETEGEAEARTKRILFEELKKIRLTPPEESELKEAKDYLKGRFVRVLETNDDQAHYLGERVLFDSLESETTYFSKIDKVTQEEIQQVVARYVREDRYNLIVLKPFGLFGKLGFLIKQIF